MCFRDFKPEGSHEVEWRPLVCVENNKLNMSVHVITLIFTVIVLSSVLFIYLRDTSLRNSKARYVIVLVLTLLIGILTMPASYRHHVVKQSVSIKLFLAFTISFSLFWNICMIADVFLTVRWVNVIT